MDVDREWCNLAHGKVTTRGLYNLGHNVNVTTLTSNIILLCHRKRLMKYMVKSLLNEAVCGIQWTASRYSFLLVMMFDKLCNVQWSFVWWRIFRRDGWLVFDSVTFRWTHNFVDIQTIHIRIFAYNQGYTRKLMLKLTLTLKPLMITISTIRQWFSVSITLCFMKKSDRSMCIKWICSQDLFVAYSIS